MTPKQQNRGFFVKQGILLVITIILLAFFTVPLLKALKAAMNPEELQTKADQVKQEAQGLETKLEVIESKIMMGGGDDQSHEKLKEQVEDLKRQLAVKDLEKNQIALAQTVQELVKKGGPAPASGPTDTVHRIADLIIKIFGSVGSLLSGGKFLLDWWTRRRGLLQDAAS